MLIAAGDRYDRLVSWSAVTTSSDGMIWTDPTEPFKDRAKVIGVTHGPDRVIAVSDAGWVSNTALPVINWKTDRLWHGNFSPQSVAYSRNYSGYDGIYMMCGQGKFLHPEGMYSELDEAGLIYTNITGENWDWRLQMGYWKSDSRFYNIRRIITAYSDAWIAVGSAEHRPIAVYSLDNGASWDDISFPEITDVVHVPTTAYDVTYNAGRFWFTLDGLVLNTTNIASPTWDASRPIRPRYGRADMIKIASNPDEHMVAVCSGGIAYCTDLSGWSLFSPPGYRFRSIIWHVDRWVASAESNLTTYTYWYSTDTINWYPANNKVQAYDFVIA